MLAMATNHDDEWQYSAADEQVIKCASATAMDIANMGKKLQELEAMRKSEFSDWSREGIILQLEHGLNEGTGLYPPPHVLPYKPIGKVDLERERSLLPKEYKYYKRPHDHKEHKKKKKPLAPVEVELPLSTDSIPLPLTLKSTFWNGDRWCGMEFSPRMAEVSNGYGLLHEELVNSQNRLKNTKMGRFFLDGLRLEEPRAHSIHYPRMSKQLLTDFRPYIPPLPLANVAQYQIELQIEENKRLLALYRDEAKRTLHSYKTSMESATSKESARSMESVPSKETTPSTEKYGGLPLKACSKLALQQLEDVLAKSTKFETLQAKFNFKLLKQLVATRSTRAYTFVRNYGALKGVRSPRNAVCDMESTPRRTEQFRNLLLRYPWFEVLINLIHHDRRRPSTAEVYILDHIRFVIQTQGKFEAANYCNLIRSLQLKNLDLNGLSVHRALDFVKKSINLTDMDIIRNLLSSKETRLPYWLEARGSLVGRAKRKLETNIFPTNTFGRSPHRPATRLSGRSNLKSAQPSTRSTRKGTKTSSAPKTNR